MGNLIFYNSVVGAECGHQDEYTVVFNYQQKIETFNQTGCQYGPDGECIVPAFESYNFTIFEYTNDAFDVRTDEETRQSQANQVIYLAINANDLPSNKKFAVKNCNFIDDDISYSMFDATSASDSSKCENRYIDLEVSSRNDGHRAFLQHRLFLLREGDQDSYELHCQIKVCDKDDLDSDCNEWYHDCADNYASYGCDNACSDSETCNADDAVVQCL